jgi:hypothetical protein
VPAESKPTTSVDHHPRINLSIMFNILLMNLEKLLQLILVFLILLLQFSAERKVFIAPIGDHRTINLPHRNEDSEMIHAIRAA